MKFIVKLLKNNGKDDNGFFVGEKVKEFDFRKEFPFSGILFIICSNPVRTRRCFDIHTTSF